MGTIKLVALDVDGTLLNHQHQLTTRTRETLTRLVAKDIHIVLATGKLFVSLREIISQLGLVAPQITSGGSIVVLPQTGEVIYRAVIPKHLSIPALELADELGVTTLIVCDDSIFAKNLNHDTDYLVSYGDPTPTLVPNLVDVLEPAPTQLVAVSTRKSLLETFHKAFLARGLGRELAIYGGLPCVLDILNPEVSKGRALQFVMERVGVQPEEAVALGDGENDTSMFRVVGHSVAMGNASVRVKQAATEVTESCDRDGLSKALGRLGL
jgi:Cof subfamily protein (haloacid dehalogenase superfamily)